ncbi:YbaY family lipoprotein [Shewanella aestuarii]|uniref:YbaY family lipoprotein n=1 Tax=Shewanella aestuarii TaxID=1028752 RepID=A0A6G9QKL6_9GAMM|nr:YbaY family lipoprotein [Shewanella aestuarii]QIR14928.1 hypothetical protein HBH39_10895 [Shewanella aestuarii]
MRQILLAAAMLVGLSACQSADDKLTISGEVFYKQRIALPADSVIKIQLQDVSLQDVAAKVVAEYQLSPATGMTQFEFVLPHDAFIAGHTYAISAKITAQDTLWFINARSYQVDVTDPKPIKVLLDLVKK